MYSVQSCDALHSGCPARRAEIRYYTSGLRSLGVEIAMRYRLSVDTKPPYRDTLPANKENSEQKQGGGGCRTDYNQRTQRDRSYND